jgi:hypothetical protein
MNNRFTLFLSVLLVWPSVIAPSEHTIAAPTEVFDQYGGAIRWEDEKSRLDNFAIQLQQEEKLLGFILVVDAVGGCPGEAQARAIRAKRYVV